MRIDFDFEHRFSHDPFTIWEALNTSEVDYPCADQVENIQHSVSHQGLDPDGRLMVNSKTIYEVNKSELRLPPLMGRFIQPLVFVVKEMVPPKRVGRGVRAGQRFDSCKGNRLIHGEVTRVVEPSKSGSVLRTSASLNVIAPRKLIDHFMKNDSPDTLLSGHISSSIVAIEALALQNKNKQF